MEGSRQVEGSRQAEEGNCQTESRSAGHMDVSSSEPKEGFVLD
jgi:hypothetical protein